MRPKLIFIDDGDRVLMRILLAACIMAILLFPITGKALTVHGFRIDSDWNNGTTKEYKFIIEGEKDTQPYYVKVEGTDSNIKVDPEMLWVKATERQEIKISVTAPASGFIMFSDSSTQTNFQLGTKLRYSVCVNLPCPSVTNVIPERTTTMSYTQIVQTTVPYETVLPETTIEKEYIQPIPTYVFVITALLVCLTICIGLLVLVLVRRKTDDVQRR